LGIANSYADWIADGTFNIAIAIAAAAKLINIPG